MLNSIIIDQVSGFISEYWSLHYYCLRIIPKLSTAFYPEIDGQTKYQKSNIEAVFARLVLNDSSRLLPMAKFAY